MRRRLLLLLVALTVLAGGPAYAAEDLTSLTNADRRAEGLPVVRPAADLQRFAQQRAEEMARSGELSHTSDLGSEVDGWERVGENVGRGSDLKTIQRGFMRSDTHRRNILMPWFSEIGVGVAQAGRLLYVAVVFREPMTEGQDDPPPAAVVAPPARRAAAPRPRPPAPAVTTTTTTPPPPPEPVAPVEDAAVPLDLAEPVAESAAEVVTSTTLRRTFGPPKPDPDLLGVAEATKSFAGYEAAAPPTPAADGGGSSPSAGTAIVVLGACAAGVLGRSASTRRRRRLPAAEVPAVVAATAAVAVSRSAPVRPHKPVSRVPRHKSGRGRSKSKAKSKARRR